MDSTQFKEFCKTEFAAYGFKKHKNSFYLAGHDLLCGIWLQKSDYGAAYYVNFFYSLGNFEDVKMTKYPTHYDCDAYGRVVAMSKSQTFQGKNFLTALIDYPEYTEEELRPFFVEAIEKIILPPVKCGKSIILKDILENSDARNRNYDLHPLRYGEIMEKLKA